MALHEKPLALGLRSIVEGVDLRVRRQDVLILMWLEGLPLYTLSLLHHGHVLLRVYWLPYCLLYRLNFLLLLPRLLLLHFG